MSALDRMPDAWWESYGHDVDCGIPGDACALLRHIVEEEREIERLGNVRTVAEDRADQTHAFWAIVARCVQAHQYDDNGWRPS